MNTLSPIEFTSTVSANEAMAAVEAEGAIAIHNFLPTGLLSDLARELRSEEMYTDFANGENDIHRRQDLSRYGFAHGQNWLTPVPLMQSPPKYIHDSAQYVANFVNSADGIDWKPNEIMGHRYKTGDNLNGHRDYERAIGYVAVVTAEGMQNFYIDRDSGERAEIYMQPGTVTIMRGYRGEGGKERPFHSVEPAKQRRLAISLRQMVEFKSKKKWS